jgi:hypothetical protein
MKKIFQKPKHLMEWFKENHKKISQAQKQNTGSTAAASNKSNGEKDLSSHRPLDISKGGQQTRTNENQSQQQPQQRSTAEKFGVDVVPRRSRFSSAVP